MACPQGGPKAVLAEGVGGGEKKNHLLTSRSQNFPCKKSEFAASLDKSDYPEILWP